MLIFKLEDSLPKLNIKSLNLPQTDSDKEAFKLKVKEYIASGTGSKLDIL